MSAEQKLTEGGVFKGAEGLRGWLRLRSFGTTSLTAQGCITGMEYQTISTAMFCGQRRKHLMPNPGIQRFIRCHGLLNFGGDMPHRCYATDKRSKCSHPNMCREQGCAASFCQKPVKPIIATVVDNNQPDDTTKISLPPKTTLDVGDRYKLVKI